MLVLFWLLIIFMTLAALGMVILPLIKQKKPAYRIAIILTLGMPLLSLTLYLHWGSSEKLEQYWLLKRQAALVKIEMAKIKNPIQVIDQLKAHLKAHPDSPKGWYLLGRIYLHMRYYQKSLLAFKKAYRLKPDNFGYAIEYVKASFLINKRLSPTMITLLKNSVKQNSNNISAINLLAINAYNNKHYGQAIEYWEHLIPLFEPGSRDSQVLLTMIARAQEKLKKGESSHH